MSMELAAAAQAAVSMGWDPEKDHRPRLVRLQRGHAAVRAGAGSPTHPVSEDAWTVWARTYDESWGCSRIRNTELRAAIRPSVQPCLDRFPRHPRPVHARSRHRHFENSRRATYAQRAYAIENPMKWEGYGENVWGLTASDGPQHTTQEFRGEQREFRHYSARGAGLRDAFDDGTIAPTAVIASLPFAPEIVIPATEEMHKRYGEFLYSSYGFLVRSTSFDSKSVEDRRLVKGEGWCERLHRHRPGSILAMIANYRDGFVWKVMSAIPHPQGSGARWLRGRLARIADRNAARAEGAKDAPGPRRSKAAAQAPAPVASEPRRLQ